MPLELITILFSVFCLDFLAGTQSAAGIVAMLISTRVVNPRFALWLTAFMLALGPLVLGSAVADTFGRSLIHLELISPMVIVAGTVGATLWSSLTVLLGIPSSTSHAMVGGLIGASVAYSGTAIIQQAGFIKVLIGLFISPFIGMVLGFLVMRLIYILAVRLHARPRINRHFQQGQLLASLLMAINSGNNEGQKMVGVIMMGVATTGYRQDFTVPLWWTALVSFILFLGAVISGKRLLNTIGRGLYTIRPVHGFAAQAGATSLLFMATGTGLPVSTTQIFNSSIVGAGSADRVNKVRWKVFDRIFLTWALTIPCAAGSAIFLLEIFRLMGLA